jgi:hypothetical protein
MDFIMRMFKDSLVLCAEPDYHGARAIENFIENSSFWERETWLI